jgi:hypothetical protein
VWEKVCRAAARIGGSCATAAHRSADRPAHHDRDLGPVCGGRRPPRRSHAGPTPHPPALGPTVVSMSHHKPMAPSRFGVPATASPCTGPGWRWPRWASFRCAGRARLPGADRRRRPGRCRGRGADQLLRSPGRAPGGVQSGVACLDRCQAGRVMATATATLHQAYRFALDRPHGSRASLPPTSEPPGLGSIGGWRWSNSAWTSAPPATRQATRSRCRGPSRHCGAKGIAPPTRPPPGGPTTPRRATHRGWTPSPGR